MRRRLRLRQRVLGATGLAGIAAVAVLGGQVAHTAGVASASGAAKTAAAPAIAAAQPSRAVGSPAPVIRNPHGDLRVACEVCHSAEGWTTMRVPSPFDHETTGFRLEGRHRNAACKDCHTSTVFSRVATSCADCHRDVHEGRNGLRCQDCHTPERWVGRSDAIREHATTGFPLVGVHALVECTRCHGNTGEASIAKLSSQCVDCHAAQYAAAPAHATGGFPMQCERCHSPARTSWTAASFDHAFTGFPLTGAHRVLNCAACHVGGTHTGLSPDCVACHQDDYAATTNPSHSASGFSTQCATCHSTNGWRPASFDHDVFFRIYSGRHRGEWTSCAQCHQNNANYRDFTCLQCHDQGETDGHHDEVQGYRYESSACYACHRGV